MVSRRLLFRWLCTLALSGIAPGCAPEPIRLHPLPPGVEYPWSSPTAAEGSSSGLDAALQRTFAQVADARDAALRAPIAVAAAAPSTSDDAPMPAPDWPNPARSAAPEPTEAPEPTAALHSEPGSPRIDLNTATLAELDTLPRVGPALAQRIVDARPFARVEQLRRVRGIGDATFAQLRDRVRVGPALPEEGSMVF